MLNPQSGALHYSLTTINGQYQLRLPRNSVKDSQYDSAANMRTREIDMSLEPGQHAAIVVSSSNIPLDLALDGQPRAD